MPDIRQATAALAAAAFIVFPKAVAHEPRDSATTGEIPIVQADYVQSDVSGPGTGGSGGPVRRRTRAQKAIAYAKRQLGCWYEWGGTGPCRNGFDCSGLTMEAWAHAGVHIPRTSQEQLGQLRRIPLRKIRPGDIVVMLGGDHVALYIGHNRLIEAPHTGARVHEVKFTGWYRENFTAVVRPW